MNLPNPTIKRLVVYRRHLEDLQKNNIGSIYSHDLADQLDLTAAVVRKDISLLGNYGDINDGYNIGKLIEKLTDVLGTNKKKKVVLFGVGNIGKALLGFKNGFEARGFVLDKVFDVDPKKIGATYSDIKCLSLDQAEDYIKKEKIKMAILAVPRDGVEALVEKLIKAGIKSFLNFVPQRLTLPEGIHCVSVDFAMELEKLSFYVNA